jgi:hypothetical protein
MEQKELEEIGRKHLITHLLLRGEVPSNVGEYIMSSNEHSRVLYNFRVIHMSASPSEPTKTEIDKLKNEAQRHKAVPMIAELIIGDGKRLVGTPVIRKI